MHVTSRRFPSASQANIALNLTGNLLTGRPVLGQRDAGTHAGRKSGVPACADGLVSEYSHASSPGAIAPNPLAWLRSWLLRLYAAIERFAWPKPTRKGAKPWPRARHRRLASSQGPGRACDPGYRARQCAFSIHISFPAGARLLPASPAP